MATARQTTSKSLTAQDLFLDAMLRHQIGVLRRSSTIRNQLLRILDLTESDLRRVIRDRLRNHTGTTSPANVTRLQHLLEQVTEIRGTAWRDVDGKLADSMREIALAESGMVDGLMKTVVPTRLATSLPAPDLVRALLVEKPLEGKLLRDWSSKLRRDDVARIHDQIRIGIVQGQDSAQISRRVVGTASLRGRNGVTEITRRQASAIVRTSANHFANQARQLYFKANVDLVTQELYVATLDGRTTPICQSLDGKRFPLGEGPIPPLHFNCRSIRTALLDEEPIGKRPMKPVTERMLLREYAARQGLGTVPRRANLPRGHKGRFDEFARGRTRELVGQVPAKVTYQQFLARQPREFQVEVLGRTKAKLFRDGGLDLDKFVDRTTGHSFTLDELATMHARSFRAAGLDPEDFFR